MSSAWSQLDQLLTCAICLDRYRNPKLLPCQHTFCMDPCLEGLVDYARRQIKCPECRAEHRIPYQGVQTFPTNVTLMRFLELHRDITGEEPEPPPSMMERCNVCSEKGYVNRCSHCEKKICDDCKEAHLDIMRREISRINNQVKRGLNRLNEALGQTGKNKDKLTRNCNNVKEELDDLIRRYIKDLNNIQEKLKQEIDIYLQNELRQIVKLKEDIEVEVANLTSNSELAEKYINEENEWTDSELVEYKEIFMKSLDFLRNFDPDTSDFDRRVKLQIHTDPDALHRTLANLGELNINKPITATSVSPPSSNLGGPQGNALMRSQSDHRLAVQFQKKQDSRSMLDISQRFGGPADDVTEYGRGRNNRDPDGPAHYRRFGDRGRELDSSERDLPRPNRYLREREEGRWRNEDGIGSQFRSRYARELLEDDGDGLHQRNVRFEEPSQPPPRERVFDTEEASRGPLSGVVKIGDSAKFMERLHQNEARQKQKKKERQERENAPPAPMPPPRRPPSRQVSEDEVEKQKKANQQAASATSNTTSQNTNQGTNETRPQVRRLTSVQKEETRPPTPKTPPDTPTPPKTPSRPESVSSADTPIPSRRGSITDDNSSATELTAARNARRFRGHDADNDSLTTRTAPVESAAQPRPRDTTGPKSPPGTASQSRPARPPMAKAVSLDQDDRRKPVDKKDENAKSSSVPQQSSFYSRLQQQQSAKKTVEEEDSDSESETTSSSSSTSSSEDDDVVPQNITPSRKQEQSDEADSSSSVTALLNRSAQVRRGSHDIRSNLDARRESMPGRLSQYAREKEEQEANKGGYRSWRDTVAAATKEEEPTPKYSSYLAARRRASTLDEDDDSSASPYTSRFLSRSRSSAVIGGLGHSRDDSPEDTKRRDSRVSALRQRRLSRSKSSHDIGPGDESPDDEAPTPTPTYRNKYERYAENALARSRSSHAIKSRETTPEPSEPSGNSSSWAQYLRNKYGSKASGSSGSSTTQPSVSRSRSSHAIYSRSGTDVSSDEETPDTKVSRYGDGQYNLSFPRSMYLQKRRMLMRIGTRGTEPGCFTWPRGVAVGPDNSVVVADSSNHRVQVFDSTGRFLHEFGTYGSSEGEFDCLAGVAVNRIGQYIVSDRYNHRIQIFDPSGRFLRSFGCEGRLDGRFNYPWGITTDSLGFIYVCDKENHRIQVFQSDGTFVGKFGSIGSRPGHLEHPHYIAVSNTNRVIVSDSNNHRIQIFDVNGRSLSTFGSEGSDDGQFKFPRGVAVDDQGYIMVGDSGNNRIQIFHPDGTFLRGFGSWGSGDGEFKGLEGIAVMANGNILVCDRENHRIQVF